MRPEAAHRNTERTTRSCADFPPLRFGMLRGCFARGLGVLREGGAVRPRPWAPRKRSSALVRRIAGSQGAGGRGSAFPSPRPPQMNASLSGDVSLPPEAGRRVGARALVCRGHPPLHAHSPAILRPAATPRRIPACGAQSSANPKPKSGSRPPQP